MAFTIADNDEAFNTNQSIIMQTDINAITAGIGGDGVVSGCAVTAQGSPDMTVAVASGTVRVAAANVSVTSGNVTITTADGTNPRIDLIVVNSSGTKSATAGTAAASPKAPDIPASSVLLAMVYVPASDTTMASNQITDKRLILGTEPLLGLANTFTLGPNLFQAGATGNVALAARRFSTGTTANIFQVQDQAGAALAYVDAYGGIASSVARILTSGTQTALAATLSLNSDGTFGDWGNNTAAASIVFESLANGTGRTASALNVQAIHRGAGQYNSTLSGGIFRADIEVNSQNVVNLVGGNFAVYSASNRTNYAQHYIAGQFAVSAEASSAQTSTDATMVLIKTPVRTNVTIPNVYGVYVEAQTQGTANYSIYTNAGIVRLGDTITQAVSDAATSATTTIQTLGHNSTGTAAAGFGSKELWNLESSTTNDQSAMDWTLSWVVATHASRTARIVGSIYDTAAREWIRGEASGTAAMIGFLGAVASVRTAITGSRAGNAALANLLTELATKGLITDSTSA